MVHLRKKYYFGKEKQYSTQHGVFLERFNRKSGSPDSLYGKCRNDFDMSHGTGVVVAAMTSGVKTGHTWQKCSLCLRE